MGGKPAKARKSGLEILFEDEHLIAVDKPAGLAVIPGRAETTCLIQQLSEQIKIPCTGTADPRLRIVHRIDKETSGVVLLAKDLPTQRHLSHQFQNNLVEKQYLAIVEGQPSGNSGLIESNIGPHPTHRDKMAVLKHGGRKAITHWEVEERFRHHALFRVHPKTGKTHQIRVHLASIGSPLIIDPLYNPHAGGYGLYLSSFKRDYRPTKGEDERPLIARLTLHAEQLIFTHPNGKKITLLAPRPKDFRATLNQLARHGI